MNSNGIKSLVSMLMGENLCAYILSIFFFFSVQCFVSRIRNCLAQLYAKDITPDDRQELDEALQREVSLPNI